MPDIQIPFCGFYESWISQGFDREEEQEVENFVEKHNFDLAAVAQAFFDCTAYHIAYDKLARAYTEAFQQYLSNEYDLDIQLEFVEMLSPREYNFTTDRIFCTISDADVKKLRDHVDETALRRVCVEHLQSRSGFISHYDPDYTTWGPVEGWDHNQLMMLLEAVVEDKDLEPDVNETLCYWGSYGEALDAAVDWEKLYETLGITGDEPNDA